MPNDPDAVIARAAAGERAAIELLLEQHLPGLHAFLRLHVGRRLAALESTSDLAQSVCRELLQGLHRFEYRGEAQFRNYLYNAALRKIADRSEYYGAQKRDDAKRVALGTGSQSSEEDGLVAAYRTILTPSRHAAAREELLQVERAFATLSDEQREVILLARMVGLSHGEIAAQLGKSEAAVRKVLSRALARLADAVAGPDSEKQ